MEGAMSRSARLLELIQALRRRRRPVAAAMLAGELGVSLRTVYRDVATLVAQGAPIEGEAGLGYVLKPGFFLPPLMFGEDEADALILGLRLVAERGDPELARAADDALAKIAAVLPPEMEEAAETSGLLAGPSAAAAPHLAILRGAMRAEEKLRLRYTDKKGAETERTVWPVALGFFGEAEVLAAWCETRRDFRHFRLDRIAAAEASGQRYPKRRRVLLAEWRMQEGLDLLG
jgi:predicted DNA-binding transcriptional regulator YafY